MADIMDGHPTSRTYENVEQVQDLIHQGMHLTIHDLCKKMNFSYSFQCILLEELNMQVFLPDLFLICC